MMATHGTRPRSSPAPGPVGRQIESGRLAAVMSPVARSSAGIRGRAPGSTPISSIRMQYRS